MFVSKWKVMEGHITGYMDSDRNRHQSRAVSYRQTVVLNLLVLSFLRCDMVYMKTLDTT